MITAEKWNYETKSYDPVLIADSCSLYEEDMDTVVTCPHCGNDLVFGEGYTSREIHNAYGLGYSVCQDCYEEELKRNFKNN